MEWQAGRSGGLGDRITAIEFVPIVIVLKRIPRHFTHPIRYIYVMEEPHSGNCLTARPTEVQTLSSPHENASLRVSGIIFK